VALLALGFRPFYLLAGCYAALSVAAWALQYSGHLPGGNVLQFKQTTVDGDPAAGVLAAREGGYYIRARLVLHGRRFYLLQVMSSSPSPPGFGRFVNSFEILPSPTGPTSQGVST